MIAASPPLRGPYNSESPSDAVAEVNARKKMLTLHRGEQLAPKMGGLEMRGPCDAFDDWQRRWISP